MKIPSVTWQPGFGPGCIDLGVDLDASGGTLRGRKTEHKIC